MSGAAAGTSADRWHDAILPQAGLLRRDWRFVSTTPSLRTRLLRVAAARRATAFPAYRVRRPITPAARWNCLFLFCPDARLNASQEMLLREARRLRGSLMVITALPPGAQAPDGVAIADAVVEKELGGFDFSAYRIALTLIAEGSPGALAYVQNDSVLGPIGPLDRLVDEAPWELTGFMASPAVENHLGSFAFVLRSVTAERVAALSPALPGDRSYELFTDVVLMQETMLARIASRCMNVGSYWYIGDAPPEPSLAGAAWRRLSRRHAVTPSLDLRGDPMLGMPLYLIQQGFPFAKRSLFGKFACSPAMSELAVLLRKSGWPSG